MKELLRIGAWTVDPAAVRVSRNGESARLDDRAMRLLLCLARRPGEVVSVEELLEQVWPEVTVSPDSVYQAVASLRRLLGDDPRQPSYIATVPRRGYQLVAAVAPWTGDESRKKPAWTAIAMAVICAVVAIAFLLQRSASTSRPEKSIVVLPFLDLTEAMSHQEFADGMTEELIDRLSKVPDIRVPGPTSSFYFRGKRVPIADIARTLGVAYVLDGSVRIAGPRMRVDVRLMRAENGFVIWSEAYDRPFDDTLVVQDEIAGEVTKALRTSLGSYRKSPRPA
jgi:TolB-like protein/DNA-binding winged helix-turn-helix (wHTH) protein